jgi:excinuclease ABC subunit A
VLAMRVEEGLGFFGNFPKIKQLLKALNDVGLSYVELGQSSTTLSGGEAQRIKLAAELGKTSTGHTLYVLDEPTTGLHFADIHNLLNVLNRLADMGNTIIVIEHNLDVVKCADWIIDLGPEGGEAGGYVVAEGTPEDIAANPKSYTGQSLARHMNGAKAAASA